VSAGGGALNRSPRAVVIGGGVTGLVAAYEFLQAGWSVTVHEASDRWGGKIWSSPVGDRMVDAGPDSILFRAEAGIKLCRRLGLEPEMTHPMSKVPAYLFVDGLLHELPAGTMFGVPTDLSLLETSSLISRAGLERAARDLTPAPTAANGGAEARADTSIGALCRERLGDEITDKLIDPLLGGINASDLDRLSLRAAAPQLAAAVDNHGSLIRGMAAVREKAGATLGSAADRPVFFSLTGGVARIIERLLEELAGADLRLLSPVLDLPDGSPATGVNRAGTMVAVDRLQADAIIDTRPPRHVINYASVSQVTLAVPVTALDEVMDTSGILFPRIGGTMLTACTWFSSKWPHYADPDTALLRLTSGRYGDDRANRLDDDTLVSTLRDEVSPVVALHGDPAAVRVHRWRDALPQYEPGHLDRVARLRAEAAERNTRLRLAGAAYDGIGIPACIHSAQRAVRELLEP
jgi:oxygen-dependent protoporphyrinogen oxidase